MDLFNLVHSAEDEYINLKRKLTRIAEDQQTRLTWRFGSGRESRNKKVSIKKEKWPSGSTVENQDKRTNTEWEFTKNTENEHWKGLIKLADFSAH